MSYSSLTIPKDYYNRFIDHIRATCPEFSKNAINTMIGTFKPKDREDRWKTLLITTSADNAFAHYLNAHGCFIDARQIGDQTYYQVYETSTTRRDETEHPLYNMIVEMEAIEVHKLNKIIEEHGGTVLDFNTDCIVHF